MVTKLIKYDVVDCSVDVNDDVDDDDDDDFNVDVVDNEQDRVAGFR